MFSTLLESKPKKQRSTGSTIFSVFLHVSLGVMAVYATARGTGVIEDEKVEEINYVKVEEQKPEPEPEPEKPREPPPDMPATPPPPKGFQVLTAPVDIPDVIPDIDLTKATTNEDDFSGRGVAGGIAKGVEGGTAPVVADAPLFEFQVEKPAMAMPGGTPPAYPKILQSANIQGQVTAMFVVDTSGRADLSTFRVLESDHDLFTSAVKTALPKMRFYAAEVGGRKVKMWVQQAFAFKLEK
jgi:protein TonB